MRAYRVDWQLRGALFGVVGACGVAEGEAKHGW
jgi:hypothetical protein